jgi:hypothetical protein
MSRRIKLPGDSYPNNKKLKQIKDFFYVPEHHGDTPNLYRIYRWRKVIITIEENFDECLTPKLVAVADVPLYLLNLNRVSHFSYRGLLWYIRDVFEQNPTDLSLLLPRDPFGNFAGGGEVPRETCLIAKANLGNPRTFYEIVKKG